MSAHLRLARSLCGATAFVALCAPAMALAQPFPAVNVRTWRPSTDPEAGLVLEPVTTPGAWQWNVGAWTHYEHWPVSLRDAATGAVVWRPVEHSIGVDLVASVGLGDRFALGVDLPFFLWQDGAPVPLSMGLGGGKLPTTGLGDMALDLKATIISNDRQGARLGFGLAALGSIALPTGNRESFMSDGSATPMLALLAEYALGVGALRATLGGQFRTAERTWPSPMASSPWSGDAAIFGDQAPWSVGVSIQPKAIAPAIDPDDRQSWEVALHGSLPAGPDYPFDLARRGAAARAPVLVAVDDHVALGAQRDVVAVLGTDFGLDGAIGAPVFRAVVSVGWAPRRHDRDADGISDDIDECPDLPEDKDGIQDADGCPEDDADGDGVLDQQDACPLVAGAPSTDPRMNGCPKGPQEQELPHAPGGK
jgi:OOP family OmpA-OmpF porin